MMSCGVYWYSPCYTLGSQSEQTAAIGPPLICSLSAMRMAGSDQFQGPQNSNVVRERGSGGRGWRTEWRGAKSRGGLIRGTALFF